MIDYYHWDGLKLNTLVPKSFQILKPFIYKLGMGKEFLNWFTILVLQILNVCLYKYELFAIEKKKYIQNMFWVGAFSLQKGVIVRPMLMEIPTVKEFQHIQACAHYSLWQGFTLSHLTIHRPKIYISCQSQLKFTVIFQKT